MLTRILNFLGNASNVLISDSSVVAANQYFNHQTHWHLHRRFEGFILVILVLAFWACIASSTNADNLGNRGLDMLKLQVISGATHYSSERSNPPRCHPGTRTAILDQISSWSAQPLSNATTPPILWLYGSAGAGKTAIAQSIAERLEAEGRLASTFFFLRTVTGRDSGKHLATTIAYQLRKAFPRSSLPLGLAIHDDPMLLSSSLEMQMDHLVAKPLRETVEGLIWKCAAAASKSDPAFRLPKTIVIDGLDEVRDKNEQRYILNKLGLLILESGLPLRLLVTSRPEVQIWNEFNSDLLFNSTARINLGTSEFSDYDIGLYIQSQFDKILENHDYIDRAIWPPPDAVTTLVRQSSGIFIYARVAMFHISAQDNPVQGLTALLNATAQVSFPIDGPYASLDAMYHHILSVLPNQTREIALDILSNSKSSSILAAKEIDCGEPPDGCECNRAISLNSILNLPVKELTWHLRHLHSVLALGAAFEIPDLACSNSPILPIHKSLLEYLHDPDRSGSFHLSNEGMHARMAIYALGHLRELLAGKDGMHKKFIFLNLWWHLIQAGTDSVLADDLAAMWKRYNQLPIFGTLPYELKRAIVDYLKGSQGFQEHTPDHDESFSPQQSLFNLQSIKSLRNLQKLIRKPSIRILSPPLAVASPFICVSLHEARCQVISVEFKATQPFEQFSAKFSTCKSYSTLPLCPPVTSRPLSLLPPDLPPTTVILPPPDAPQPPIFLQAPIEPELEIDNPSRTGMTQASLS